MRDATRTGIGTALVFLGLFFAVLFVGSDPDDYVERVILVFASQAFILIGAITLIPSFRK